MGNHPQIIPVQVAYVTAQRQHIVNLQVALGSTIATALSMLPQLMIAVDDGIGVFNKIRNLDYILQPNDRIEIYRPLLLDPKERRKQKAKQQAARKKLRNRSTPLALVDEISIG